MNKDSQSQPPEEYVILAFSEQNPVEKIRYIVRTGIIKIVSNHSLYDSYLQMLLIPSE
jgi:hypothetical protein